MEAPIKPIQGMMLDTHPSNQPPNTTREVRNMVMYSKEGNIMMLSNENGDSKIITGMPDGFFIIGKSVLEDKILVILCDDAGHSQVGSINTEGTYTPNSPVEADGVTVSTTNKELGFSKEFPVDCVSRRLINDHVILYYTDNNKPVGYIDFENPPVVGNVENATSLLPTMKVPIIDVVSVINKGGSLKATTYFFITRYKTKSGGFTSFGIPSNGVPIIPNETIVNRIKGIDYTTVNTSVTPNTTTDTVINKSIVLRFSNLDLLYSELQIVACWYDELGVLQTGTAGDIPISSSSIDFTFTGIIEGESINLTLAELRKVNINYKYAEAIEQKDNVLILSNLRGNIEEDLQLIANKIEVTYDVEEVRYCNREATENKFNSSSIFEIDYAVAVSNTSVNFVFNEDIDTTPDVSSFILYQPHKVAEATLTVTSFTTPGTITLALGSVANVTLTATTSTPLLITEFQTTTSNEVTASNLAACINQNCPNYNATIDSAFPTVIKLLWIGVDTAGTGYGNTLALTVPAWITKSSDMAGGALITGPFTPSIGDVTVTGNTATVVYSSPVNYIKPLSTSGVSVSNLQNLAATSTFTSPLDINSNPVKTQILITPPSQPVSFVTGSDDDYINPITSFYKKGYRRGEVYSLGFYLLYKDGSKSLVYHIPGNDKSITTSGKNPANTITKRTGTYVSSLEYPLNQDHISGKIRHHVMPTLSQEPSYRYDAVNDDTFIRILNLNFQFINAIPDSILSSVSEVVFVRELRNTENKRSILSQGLVANFAISAQAFISNSRRGQDDDRATSDIGMVSSDFKYHIQTIPFCNRLRSARNVKTPTELGYFSQSRGIAYPGIWTDNAGGTITWPTPYFNSTFAWTTNAWADPFTENVNMPYSSFKKLNTDLVLDQVMFQSPETLLETSFKVDDAQGCDLVKVAKLKGVTAFTNNKPETWDVKSSAFDYDCFQSRYAYADTFTNFYDIESVTDDKFIIEKSSVVLSGANNKSTSLFDLGTPVNSTGSFGVNSQHSPGGLHLKLNNNISLAESNTNLRWYESQLDERISIFSSNQNNKQISRVSYETSASVIPNNKLPGGHDINEYLYNIEKPIDNQYGSVSNAEYSVIGRYPIVGSAGAIYANVFGGDTFITKFAINGGNVLYKLSLKINGSVLVTSNDYGQCCVKSAQDRQTNHYDERAASNPNITAPNGRDYLQAGFPGGAIMKEVMYYFVESDINTYYRHSPVSETQANAHNYYPAESNLGKLFTQWPLHRGNVTNYNGLYSYENKIITYFNKGSTQELVSDFPCRSIWSERALTDSTVDSYRSFLPENYYDLPSHTGAITDSFVYENTLYLHTSKCLWRTFAEPAAILDAVNISGVVLGTGSLFARPSVPMTTSKGGHGGTLSKFAGIATPIGYIFPDRLQGKVLSLSGEGLKDLSELGLINYLNKNLNVGITGKDNPFYSGGIISEYDHHLKRYILVNNGSSPFTLSFSILNNKWISFHDYSPNVMVALNARLFFYSRNTFTYSEMNIGNKGEFNEVLYPSLVTISFGEGEAKTFSNYIFKTYTSDGVSRVIKDSFNTIKSYNASRNTGVIELQHIDYDDDVLITGKSAIKFKNDQYRISLTRDLVKNPLNDIQDPSNLFTALDEDFYYAKRLKGDYIVTELTYDNEPNYDFVLNEIILIFDFNIR